MARLGMVERDTLPEDERRFHDAVWAIRRRPISGPFIVTMNSSPDLAARFAHLGHYFHARGQADESIVSIRVRAFISLIGSRALDAPYEWAAWVNWALEAGIPQDTVDAIRETILREFPAQRFPYICAPEQLDVFMEFRFIIAKPLDPAFITRPAVLAGLGLDQQQSRAQCAPESPLQLFHEGVWGQFFA